MFKNLDLAALGISGRQSELIELTLSYGFNGFDLDLTEFRSQVDRQGIDRARRLIDSARLKLGTFQLPIDWDADDENFEQQLDQLAALAETVAAVGCTRCRATIAPASDQRPYHENFELYRTRFAQIGEKIDPHGIRLGIGFLAPASYRENRVFQFLHSFDALLLLVKSVAVQNIGVVLDTWHWHVAGGTMQQIEVLTADDIVAVDIADATTPAGQDDVDEATRALPVPDGTIDVPAILAALAKIEFDGPVTPKPGPNVFEGATRQDIFKRTKESLDTVWSAAKLNKRGKLVAG